LEAELFELERQQDELDERDFKGDLKAKEYVRDFGMLISDNDLRCIERKRLMLNLRDKIKEYRKCYSLVRRWKRELIQSGRGSPYLTRECAQDDQTSVANLGDS
jgi:hypothetical protein